MRNCCCHGQRIELSCICTVYSTPWSHMKPIKPMFCPHGQNWIIALMDLENDKPLRKVQLGTIKSDKRWSRMWWYVMMWNQWLKPYYWAIWARHCCFWFFRDDRRWNRWAKDDSMPKAVIFSGICCSSSQTILSGRFFKLSLSGKRMQYGPATSMDVIR